MKFNYRWSLVSGLALALAACGGGGGSPGVAVPPLRVSPESITIPMGMEAHVQIIGEARPFTVSLTFPDELDVSISGNRMTIRPLRDIGIPVLLTVTDAARGQTTMNVSISPRPTER